MPNAPVGGLPGAIDSIVADAMSYPHHVLDSSGNIVPGNAVPYKWGKANPRGWDCSGYVNYVLGHDLGYTLPGGVKDFSGTWHGPVVAQYATWKGAGTVREEEPGDLAVWVGLGAGGHIGIVTGKNEMISALDPQYGTVVTPIRGYGPAGAPLIFRRVGNSQNANAAIMPGCTSAMVAVVAITGRTLWTNYLRR